MIWKRRWNEELKSKNGGVMYVRYSTSETG
jgi:hypothetical protein